MFLPVLPNLVREEQRAVYRRCTIMAGTIRQLVSVCVEKGCVTKEDLQDQLSSRSCATSSPGRASATSGWVRSLDRLLHVLQPLRQQGIGQGLHLGSTCWGCGSARPLASPSPDRVCHQLSNSGLVLVASSPVLAVQRVHIVLEMIDHVRMPQLFVPDQPRPSFLGTVKQDLSTGKASEA
eukprot:412048-Hanusia_phi.AAC.2